MIFLQLTDPDRPSRFVTYFPLGPLVKAMPVVERSRRSRHLSWQFPDAGVLCSFPAPRQLLAGKVIQANRPRNVCRRGGLMMWWDSYKIWGSSVALIWPFAAASVSLIIITKICSAHISTLLGAQGAETEKKHEYKQFAVIAKIKLCTEIHVQCNYKYTSSLKNCDIRWVLSSDLNLVILWQDLSLGGRWFQSLGAATEKDLSPQVRFEVGSFRSDMLLERKLRDVV